VQSESNKLIELGSLQLDLLLKSLEFIRLKSEATLSLSLILLNNKIVFFVHEIIRDVVTLLATAAA